MKILIAAGGSGGHIFPAIALAQAIREKAPDANIRFVASNKSLDRRIVIREGLNFSLLSANKLPYKASLKLPVFFIKLAFDTVRTFFIIIGFRPDVIVGFGGYIAFPVISCAYILRIPSVVHEQNVVPGRANRFLFKLADRIAISFEETKGRLGSEIKKAAFTGNPIRAKSFKGDRDVGIRAFGLDRGKFTILLIGGSQGAHRLNKIFAEAVSMIDDGTKQNLQIIHLTGVSDYEWAIEAYESLGIERRVYSFIDRIEEAYSAADLIVTRSGASALFEIAFFGKAMILVPYPFAMSHQAENAMVFSGKGAAIQLEEKALSPDILKNQLMSLIGDRARLRELAENARRLSVPDASERLAGETLSLVKG